VYIWTNKVTFGADWPNVLVDTLLKTIVTKKLLVAFNFVQSTMCQGSFENAG